MKNYFLLLITALGLILSGCTKEESDPLQVERITGTWVLSTIDVGGYEFPAADMDMALTFTFTASGTWTGTSSGMELPSGSGTYTITNTTPRLKEGGSTTKFEIESLTETQVVLYSADFDYSMTLVRH